MEKFYDKIKDKMSNTPEAPTDWGMWEDIESTLDKKRKNRFLPVFIGLPLLLFAAGVIGYLLAPKPDSTISEKVELIRDTIYLTESIHTVDTILQTEYITKWRIQKPEESLAFQSQIQNLSNLNTSLLQSIDGLNNKLKDYRYAFSESGLKNDPKYRKLDFFNPESTPNLPSDNISLFVDRSGIEAFDLSPLLDSKMLDYERPRLMLIHNLLFENLVKNKKSKNLLDHLIPDYFNIGVSIETPGFAFTKDLSPGLEMGFGFNAELMFSPRFSLVTGIRSRSTQNKTTDALIASSYPQPVTTSEEVFKNLNVKSSYIDIPLTFKYDVFKLRQNNVYLTGGLLLSKHSQTEYKYEYNRNTTEIYYEEKVAVNGWSLGSSVIGIGYELEPWSNTSAFIESYARYNFKSDKGAIHGVGFRFGMYYKI